MEWYRKADGEVVFGEIGARPPGARVVDVMNYATDGDLFAGWARGRRARARCSRWSGSTTPASIFKRARGAGPDHPLRGPRRAAGRYGEHVALRRPAAGRARRAATGASTVIGDGMIIVRHPELQQVIEMTEAFAARLPDVRV